jgi:hypothetical protein
VNPEGPRPARERLIGVGLGLALSVGIDLQVMDEITFVGLCGVILGQLVYLLYVAVGPPSAD